MAPTANLMAFSGTRRSGACTTSPMAATAASAASAALAAARQPMLRLTARTMVKASTHSTAAVRKAGTTTVQSSMRALLIDLNASVMLSGGDQLDQVGAAVPNDLVGEGRAG